MSDDYRKPWSPPRDTEGERLRIEEKKVDTMLRIAKALEKVADQLGQIDYKIGRH